MNIQKNENYVENQLTICYFLTRKGCCMMMTCLGIAIFLTLFAGNVNALSDWQVTVPEKEHVASYQIVCDDWKIHYVVNGNEYQYCLKCNDAEKLSALLKEGRQIKEVCGAVK